MGTDPPIGGLFDVDPGAPLADVAGGLEAFAVTARRPGSEKLMAVRVRRDQTPRAHPVATLATAIIPGVLTPMASGNARDRHGRPAAFVICRRPPGPPLSHSLGSRPWSEIDLIDRVLRPIAATLSDLQAREVTHRAIRADNVFQASRNHPVVLGCAWAGPAAADQPVVYEPPYSAVCLPEGRGDGQTADDVYALGVLLITLAAGVQPMAGMEQSALIARRLAQGSFTALTADLRLPPMIADLTRGMLAEDPDHRPSPELLTNPEAARSRRVANRPARVAQRPIEVGGRPAWGLRSLAHALSTEPVHAPLLLRSGSVDRWLRRALSDVSLAQAIDEVVKARVVSVGVDEIDADSLMVMKVVALLDPFAPPCWRGLMLWPSALGTCLAAAPPEQEPMLVRMVMLEALVAWANIHPDRHDAARLRMEAMQHRRLLTLPGWGGGLARLRYVLNPLLPCRAPHVQAAMVVRMADLLPALEAASAQPDRPTLPINADIGAFIAARFEQKPDPGLVTMSSPTLPPGEAALAQLRTLERIQSRHQSPVVPGVASWLAAALSPALDLWRSRTRQANARAALEAHAAAGRLAPLLALVDDPATQASDLQAAAAAEYTLYDLDAQIEAVAGSAAFRREQSRRLGQEIASACGAIAAAVAVAVALI